MKRWAAVPLEEIPARYNGWIPIRDHLGIEAFGINAWTKRSSDGAVIAPHTETDVGHEELYFVYRGHAVITVGEDEIDAPAGTIVFVEDPDLTRGARPRDDDTIVFTVGGKPGAPFEVSAWEQNWEWNAKAFPLYEQKRYSEAAAVLRDAIAAGRDDAQMHYNLGCFLALAGDRDEALEHLRIASADPSFAVFAKSDPDLDSVRDDPRFPS